MRVVITGASGNVGTSLLESLANEDRVTDIVGIVRRLPRRTFPKTSFVAADVVSADLVPIFRGADAVVHLAWLIQPGRDESVTYAVNVTGSERVFNATVNAGVPTLVYASSVGAYSPGPKDTAVDESWPTDGIESSFYARHKAAVERILDRVEAERPELRVVRLRPGLIFKREAATEIRRLFLGPFVPRHLIRPKLIPVVPDVPRLRFQAVHSLDVGEAYRLALVTDAAGAFNIAAEPAIGPSELASLLGARPVKLPASALRAAAAATYALRAQPAEPGWVDMGLAVPIMDTSRARSVLGWSPSRTSLEALRELIAGLHGAADEDTPPLARATSGIGRIREVLTGIGQRV
jgi:nucleoside-diphosphate-sugar epimerase